MRYIDEFPFPVRELENVWIPMSDGVRLAARVWIPETPDATPVPAILESIPYRKRDGTRERDETMHRYFAGHGFATLRVDVRGSGDSDGILADEYSLREQEDGIEIIHWLAEQPWCDGNVGMIGKSWGGIAALQIAARRPAPLRAVITVCSTADRYGLDAHYMGGALLVENLVWGSLLMVHATQPPDPEIVGDRWRTMWHERLGAVQPFPEIWMRHSQRDAYWRQGSVSEDLSRIECPVYAVSGWADAYTDTVPQLLAGLRGPRKGLVGPWAHLYPHEGVPGPAIGFLQEALRWWNQWLRGVETGIIREPMYRVWMQEAGSAAAEVVPGRWVAEESWPSPRIEPWIFDGVDATLRPRPVAGIASPSLAATQPSTPTPAHPLGGPRPPVQASLPRTLASSQSAGVAAGPWCSFGIEPGRAQDQREDDTRSLTFDSAPLATRVELLGAPVVRLTLAADRPSACITVRLCDVAPDDSSTRISYAVLDLTPQLARAAGKPFEAQVTLRHAGYALPPGHRLRVALSTSYWPVVWPSPEPVTLTVFPGGTALELPVRPLRAADESLRPFPAPEGARPADSEELHPTGFCPEVERNAENGEVVQRTWLDADVHGNPAMVRYPAIDLEVGHGIRETFHIRDDDPLAAAATIEHRTLRRRAGWETSVMLRVSLSATRMAYRFEAELEARDGDRRIASRQWDTRIPRSTSA